MANTASNVLVGQPLVTGGLSISLDLIQAAVYPTDATAPIQGMQSCGYIGEDGVTETNGRDTEQIKAWGGSTVRRVQTDHSIQYKFTFLESKNAVVLKAVYGQENVLVTEPTETEKGLIAIKKNAKTLPHMSLDMNMLDGTTRIRNFVPDGQIVETGDVVFVHSDVIKYEVTVEAFEDANGDKALQLLEV